MRIDAFPNCRASSDCKGRILHYGFLTVKASDPKNSQYPNISKPENVPEPGPERVIPNLGIDLG